MHLIAYTAYGVPCKTRHLLMHWLAGTVLLKHISGEPFGHIRRLLVGIFEKAWESLGRFGCIAANWCDSVRMASGHHPARCSPERSVYRLQRALPASVNYRYLPLFPVQHRAAHPASLHYAATSRRAHHDSISYAAVRRIRPASLHYAVASGQYG